MARSLLIASSLILSLLTFPALATTDKADQDARMEKAQALITITGAANLSEQMITMMMAQISQIVNRLNPGHEAEVKAVLEEYFLPEVKAALPELSRGMAGIYAANFTVAEMDAVIAFYNTPVGAKMLKSMPVIAQQSMAVGQAWGRGVSERANAKFLEALKQKGLNAPKQL